LFVADWDDVRRIALALPDTGESLSWGTAAWRVKDKMFVWDRPLRETDHAALGADAPEGAILAARVADLGVRESLIADEPGVFFTIPHFDDYPAVLARLDVIALVDLEELIVEAWLCRAPKRLVAAYLAREH
jgi:hypothetical protein